MTTNSQQESYEDGASEYDYFNSHSSRETNHDMIMRIVTNLDSRIDEVMRCMRTRAVDSHRKISDGEYEDARPRGGPTTQLKSKHWNASQWPRFNYRCNTDMIW